MSEEEDRVHAPSGDGDSGKSYMSLNDFIEFLEEEERNRPWYQKVFHGVSGRIRRIPGAIRWRWALTVNVYQRARYGVGFVDMWSYDEYVAKNIVRTCRWMVENQHVYPGENLGFTPKEWSAYLSDIADDLEVYLSLYDEDHYYGPGDYAELTNTGISAMKRFSEYFNHVVD